MAVEKLSPGMQQYLDIKKDYPDAFLLFRMGDFYELFYDDAVNAAQILEISLTSRNKNAENPIPMAGVPYHSAQQYIDVLVESGYKGEKTRIRAFAASALPHEFFPVAPDR